MYAIKTTMNYSRIPCCSSLTEETQTRVYVIGRNHEEGGCGGWFSRIISIEFGLTHFGLYDSNAFSCRWVVPINPLKCTYIAIIALLFKKGCGLKIRSGAFWIQIGIF